MEKGANIDYDLFEKKDFDLIDLTGGGTALSSSGVLLKHEWS